MSIAFTRTREQLARMVLRKLGVLGTGSDISADMDLVYEAVDLRLKTMHKDGIFWRKVDEVPLSFSLDASVNTASATADILFPIKVTVLDGQRDEPVTLIGPREYAAIPEKGETGTPTKAMWKGGAEFIFHPVPLTATTAKLLYNKIADDTSAGSAPDVEVSMLRWLKDIIAYDLGDEFAQSEAKMQRLRSESGVAERAIHKLAMPPRVDLAPVAVDDWTGGGSTETDYEADR